MQRMKIYLPIILVLSLANSCTQVKKEIATDQFSGTYAGKVIYLIQYSSLNQGYEDQQTEEDIIVTVKKEGTSNIILQVSDGIEIKLSSINLLQNGTAFNIPAQDVTSTNGSSYSIEGVSGAELTDGQKYDGIYTIEGDRLLFTMISTSAYINGEPFNVPITWYYDLKKIG